MAKKLADFGLSEKQLLADAKDPRSEREKKADAQVYFSVEMDRLVEIGLNDGLSRKCMKKRALRAIKGDSFFKGKIVHDPKAIHDQAMRIAERQNLGPGEIPNVDLEIVDLGGKNFAVMAVDGRGRVKTTPPPVPLKR